MNGYSDDGRGGGPVERSAGANEPPFAPDSPNTAKLKANATQDQLVKLLQGTRLCEESRKNPDVDHKFWGSMPVPQMSEELMKQEDAALSGPIDDKKTIEMVKKDAYKLPDGFEWTDCDVHCQETIKEIYTLLNENYVEDDDCMFRFDYAPEFITWALTPPGFHPEWHVGVRASKSQKLVAFITGCPAHMNVHGKSIKMAEVNFLCVHKKLRSKRLAPVLIKEITRRVNLKGIWQAAYTAGVLLPKPIGEARYYHRSLNPKKLVDVGFSHMGSRMTMARMIRLYKLPDAPQIKGIRKMEDKDVPQVTKLLSEYLKKFKHFPEFDEDDVRHHILPKDGVSDKVVYAYVVENGNKVTDFVSFYALPSSILRHDKHTELKAAYSFWNVATTADVNDLMNDALIFAQQNKFDVFNCLDIMDNKEFLDEMKFGIGDGYLHYYLFNYRCPNIESQDIGLVLL